MRTRLTALGTALVAGLLLTTPADAAKNKPKPAAVNPRGEPAGFHKGLPACYAVWHDGRGWHLRTTTTGKKHRFRGRIEVQGGVLEAVHSFHLEKSGKLADHWKLHPKKHALTFDFETDNGIDGIAFRVSPKAKSIHFNLHIDGKHQAGRIFVGRAGHHPLRDPFTLAAHPGQATKPTKTKKIK
jgi:hypothetical protein